MNQDLGCLELRAEDTSWQNGIIFVPAYEIGRSGCFSALGVAQHFYNDGSFGYPETWQVIALSESCAGTSQATVQHEILHALGIHHEHNRPDRDSFLVVNTDVAGSPSNFEIIPREYWDDTGFEFDINSVMTYCSFCGSMSPSVPVMTTRTGITFSSGARMTSTDALQVRAKYCSAPFEKETVSCSSSDILGKFHLVFADRLCDNFRDCPDGEDEGVLSECETVGEPTPNDCCGTMFFNGEECNYDSEFGAKDSWICLDENGEINKSIFYVYQLNTWYIGKGAQPNIYEGWKAYDQIVTDEVCPPRGTWESGNSVTCKVKPVVIDHCAEKVCAGNLICENRNNEDICVCKEPNFIKDGFCTIPVNECEEETDSCTDEELCVDLQDGYECKPDPTITEDDCCRTIVMETNLWNEIVCEFESWVNDAMAYNCLQRKIGGYSFDEQMSMMFFEHQSNYYLLKGTIEQNKHASSITFYDKLNVKSFRECPVLGSPADKGYNWLYENMYTCEKVYEPHMGAWSTWSSCSNSDNEEVDSDTCGQVGTRIRRRSCDHWDPTNCEEDEATYEQQECGSYCTWSDWGAWSACDAQCGSEGTVSRERFCPGNACDDTEEFKDEQERNCTGSCPSYDYSCSNITIHEIRDYCSNSSTNNYVAHHSAFESLDEDNFKKIGEEMGLYKFAQFRDGYMAHFHDKIRMHFTGDKMEDGLFYCVEFLKDFTDKADQRSEEYEEPDKFELIALCSEAPVANSTWGEWSDLGMECSNGKTLRFRKCPSEGVCEGKKFEIIDCEETTTSTENPTSTTETSSTTTTTTMMPSSDGCLLKNLPKGLEPKKPEDLWVTTDGELFVAPDQRIVVLCGDGFIPHMNKNYAKATCSCSDDKCFLTDFSREIKCISFENAPMPIWSSIQKHVIIRMKESESYAVLKMKVKPWYSEKYYGNMEISKKTWANSQFTLLVACPFETSAPSMLELLHSDTLEYPLSSSANTDFGNIYTFVGREDFTLGTKAGKPVSIAFQYDKSTLPEGFTYFETGSKKKPGVTCNYAVQPGVYPTLGSDLYKHFGENIPHFMKIDQELWKSTEL